MRSYPPFAPLRSDGHALVLDGVYVLDAFGYPAFAELKPPTLDDLNHLAARIAQAVLALLRRRRIWLDDLDGDEDPVAQRSSSLAGMARASIAGTLVFGHAGAKPVRLQDGRPWVAPQAERAGKALGFVLDAEVRVSAHNRLHRERLCRYLLRPPLAKGRLHETLDGKYAFELKTPWPDGTRVIFFSGDELVARLTALVPPPRMHQVHYFGVLAPNAKLRKFVVPEPPENEDTDPCGPSIAYEQTTTGKSVRRRWIPWATMLLRVFAIDVLACPHCQGRMQRVAWTIRPQRSAGRIGPHRHRRWRPRRGEGRRPESSHSQKLSRSSLPASRPSRSRPEAQVPLWPLDLKKPSMGLTMAKPCPTVVPYFFENSATGLRVRNGWPFLP